MHHHANGVPAQHPRRVALKAGAHFGVYRIDRDSLHSDQQITPVGGGDRQVDPVKEGMLLPSAAA